MKFNVTIALTLLLFMVSNVALAQRKGKKGKSISSDVLNMTFERLQEDEEVTELRLALKEAERVSVRVRLPALTRPPLRAEAIWVDCR